MSGGSIYIDPDSVSNMSSQIGMTADHLDSLRQTIVPRVNEVISMSYPSIHEIPSVAYPLNSAQDSIEAFNYRVHLLVEDLRTTSLKLSQIAEAGRTMNEILLRQSTTFGSGGVQGMLPRNGANSGATPKIPDWLQQLVGTTDTPVGLASWLIGVLKKTDAFANNEAFKNFDTRLSGISETLDAVSFYIDVINGSHDAKTLTSKFIGENISNLVKAIAEDNPYVAGVMATFGAISLAGAGLGSLQGSLANQYAGNPQLQKALNSTAQGLADASNRANPQKVFDDAGGTIFDVGSAILGFGSWASVSQDTRGMVNDTASTLYSVPEFVDNTAFMVQQDSNLGINAVIQNTSLPQSWKSAYQTQTIQSVELIGNASNVITNSIPQQAGHFTDMAQQGIATGSQQFYNQEVVVQ